MFVSHRGLFSAGWRLVVGFALALGLLAMALVPSAKSAGGAHTVALNGHTFTLPDGFTIELATTGPLADRPVSAALDEKRRLYVTDSSGSNAKMAEQMKTKPHRIVRLEDTNRDGTFDRSTVFVKNVMFPEGAMWYRGSLYVAAPPHILKFTDTDDDGTADQEEIWFDGKTVGGCGNDLHGPVLGPDGWFYWTKGGFEKQEYTLADGKKWTSRAAHVFRAKPDGSKLEPVMTGGMDNPVGIAFTPTGEVLVCGTFFQHPAGGRRDGILHATYGGVYGKDHSPIYEHPWTAPQLMPVMTHLGPAAPASLMRYQGGQFGTDYTGNLFCSQFNMRKVSRHILVPEGATYRTLDSDFVVSDNRDFHPTDVVQDADGSLLILDTGGWFKLCCPTSQLVKEDVKGAIYRVRKAGVHTTARKPSALALPPLKTAALTRDAGAFTDALAGLKATNLADRRLAAEALGRLGNPAAVPAILDALANDANDRTLDHSLTYALIELNAREATAAGLTHASPRVRRAALTALDQMPGGPLDARPVLAALDDADAALKETAWWIAGRHSEWGEALAARFAAQLAKAETLAPAVREELAGQLEKFTGNAAVQAALADALAKVSPAGKRLALKVMAQAKRKALPEVWRHGLLAAAPTLADAETLRAAFTLLRTLPLAQKDFTAFVASLPKGKLWPNGAMPADFRLMALAARPAGSTLDEEAMAFLLAAVNRNETVAVRSEAADALVKARLTPAQARELAAALKAVGPLEFAHLLPAFTKVPEAGVGTAFLAALSDPAVRRSVRIEQVKPILDKFPKAVRAEAEKLYAQLAEDRKEERAKLDALVATLPAGDARRGQDVFNGAKAACIACHTIGYVGGNVGPDLRKIGAIRSERDLLEAIVFPSASFVRSYEPFRVVTADGKSYNGVLRQDTPGEVVLAVAANQEVRIPRADIEEMTPSSVSVMPAGLDQQLSPQELADVVAFLKANTR